MAGPEAHDGASAANLPALASSAEDLQILIAQVAQMDDDLSDPTTTNRAKKEYRAIVREFKEAGISPSG